MKVAQVWVTKTMATETNHWPAARAEIIWTPVSWWIYFSNLEQLCLYEFCLALVQCWNEEFVKFDIFRSVRAKSSILGEINLWSSLHNVADNSKVLIFDEWCTKLYQNVLSLSKFSGEVTWPVCTGKDKRIHKSDIVLHQPPMSVAKHAEHADWQTIYILIQPCKLMKCNIGLGVGLVSYTFFSKTVLVFRWSTNGVLHGLPKSIFTFQKMKKLLMLAPRDLPVPQYGARIF